ncbi:MAG: hypothetical protein ACI9QQ_002420 [Myxococcota bacterium]|jgi:hypothetical protein
MALVRDAIHVRIPDEEIEGEPVYVVASTAKAGVEADRLQRGK